MVLLYRKCIDFEEMATGLNKRRIIQSTVFNELCKVSCSVIICTCEFQDLLLATGPWCTSLATGQG